MDGLYYAHNGDARKRVWDSDINMKKVPLVAFIDELSALTSSAPECVRDTLTIERQCDYDGEPYIVVYRRASEEEIAADEERIRKGNAEWRAKREAEERREFERLSRKFAAD